MAKYKLVFWENPKSKEKQLIDILLDFKFKPIKIKEVKNSKNGKKKRRK